MKPAQAKAIIEDCRKRGYVQDGNTLYPPLQAERLGVKSGKDKGKRSKSLKTLKTGWTDDSRNLKNKEVAADMFIKLMQLELNVDVWPEFYFSTERLYRFDYAIPDYMITVEVNGGIWRKGKSGHSSGKGIKRDMDKSNLAQSAGWRVISVEPNELLTSKTIEIIKGLIKK